MHKVLTKVKCLHTLALYCKYIVLCVGRSKGQSVLYLLYKAEKPSVRLHFWCHAVNSVV